MFPRLKAWLKNSADTLAVAWRLRPHLRGGRYLIAAVAGTSFAAALLEGVGVSLLLPLLSLLLEKGGATPMRPIRWAQSWLPGYEHAFYVVLFCVFVLGAIAAKNALIYVSQVLAAKLKRRISINLRDALFGRIHRAELHLFEHRTPGDLTNALFGETGRTLGIIDLLLYLSQRLVIALFYFVSLLVLSWPLTLITVLLTGAIGASVAVLHRNLARFGREISEANARLGAFVLESFSGVRVIRTTNSQVREQQRFNDLSDKQSRIEEKAVRTSSLLIPIAETMAVAGAMMIVGLAYLVFVAPGKMLPSHLLVFGFILLRLLPLVNQIYGLQGNLVYLSSAIKEVEKWMASPEYPHRPFGSVRFPGVRQGIRFDHVSFTYSTGTLALADVTFEIPAGKTVALVGASGSGKSTAAALLLRFRQPTGGRILVDGVDYWEFGPESWHQALGVVEQEAFLFHDTMAQNIGYGFPEVSPAAVQSAVHAAQLEDVISALPEGLNTIVGERGILLSGGQRQRLAIARALVRNPQILILDEATSALDTLSEQQVQAALNQATQNRTVLVIAHRLSTVRHADQIVVLDQGRVAEQGKWEELVARGGRFAGLVNLNALRE